MATTITAGNATNGAAVSSDNTGILELKTGTGSGTTAISIATNQIVTGTAGNLMLVSGTAITLTNQTAPAFTDIPSWVKRATLVFNGVRISSAATPLVQLGTGSTPTYTTSGYVGGSQNYTTSGTSAATAANTGFPLQSTSATNLIYGNLVLTNISGNNWVISGTYYANSVSMGLTNGSIALSGVLTAVRLFVDGTQTFNLGTVNFFYE